MAARLYRLACDGGHAVGCKYLAMNLELGLGIEVDLDEAARYYARSCDLADGEACARLRALAAD